MTPNLETYIAQLEARIVRGHAEYGCTTRCFPDCKWRIEVIDTSDMTESAQLLAEYTPSTTDEMADVCAEIHRAMDAADALQAAEDKATAEAKAVLEKLRAPFREQQAAAAALIVAGKAALVRRVEADEQALLDAVAAKSQVPAAVPLPKGLRSKRTVVLSSVDAALLTAEFLSIVPDTNAILSAAEAGLEVPGAVVDVKFGVVYTRPKKK